MKQYAACLGVFLLSLFFAQSTAAAQGIEYTVVLPEFDSAEVEQMKSVIREHDGTLALRSGEDGVVHELAFAKLLVSINYAESTAIEVFHHLTSINKVDIDFLRNEKNMHVCAEHAFTFSLRDGALNIRLCSDTVAGLVNRHEPAVHFHRRLDEFLSSLSPEQYRDLIEQSL